MLQWYIATMNYAIWIPNLTQIDAKTLVIALTSILKLISYLKDEKNASCENFFQAKVE